MSNVNPMELIQMIRGGQNPEQLMLNLLQARAKGNPFMQNLLTMARNNNTRGIEQVVRNMAQQRGIDYDKAFEEFKRTLK